MSQTTQITDANLARPAGTLPTEHVVEIYGLLAALKIAVDDIRSQLGAKHKGHYTVNEVARLTGRSAYTVRRWIAEQRIKAIRINGTGPNGRLLVSRDQLEVLIAEGLAAAVPDAVAGE